MLFSSPFLSQKSSFLILCLLLVNLLWWENNILFLSKCISQYLEGLQPVLDSDMASSVVSVTQPNDSKAISFRRAYLTYDTLWALPSNVVYSSRSAYILSMGGPSGKWSSYPDSAGADICSTDQATQKMKSLTLAALVLGPTHWAPWEIEFLTLADSCAYSSTQRAAKLQNFKR